MAHSQKPDFVFRRNWRVHLNRRGRHFSRLLAAEVCASAVVMLDTPCSEVVWRVLATHSIRQFPPWIPLPCVTVCHHISTGFYHGSRLFAGLSARCRLEWDPTPFRVVFVGAMGKTFFFLPQTLRFSTVSTIPSLLHTHSSIHHLRYLISGNDNALKRRTEIVTVLRSFLTVSLHSFIFHRRHTFSANRQCR